jgi:hypothetical protein
LNKIFTIAILVLALNFSAASQSRQFGIADAAAKVVKFFPNPATTSINFEFQRGFEKSYSLQVFNFMGRKVFDRPSSPQRIFVPLDNFFRGVYIYQVRNQYGKIVDSGKFQVVK